METRWQHVKTMFAEAVKRHGEERFVFLQEACGSATELRAEVEELLLAHERAGNDFAVPAAEVFAPLLSENFKQNLTGQKLGVFRVEDEIGRGGMGVVYRAHREDGEFEQKVAIKVLQIRSAEFLRRFRHERQTLAALNHPNIARFYDGGVTAEGLPYFVMECVAGHALHDYCVNHALDLRARLALFLQNSIFWRRSEFVPVIM